METGHIVYFASQKSPFLVEAEPCLDLGCSCRNMTLTLSELILPGSPRRDSLRFTIRVSLRTWREQDAPPRSLEVETLVGEFLARFPDERIDELVQQFETARAGRNAKRRWCSLARALNWYHIRACWIVGEVYVKESRSTASFLCLKGASSSSKTNTARIPTVTANRCIWNSGNVSTSSIRSTRSRSSSCCGRATRWMAR